jgi:hypothetical protein
MRKARINIVIILLLIYSVVVIGQDIHFFEMEDLPEARSALTSANNEENIFIVNGFGANEQYADEIFQYNIFQNSWATLTSLTIPKRFASAEIVGNFLYVFNGTTEGGILNRRVEKIDLTDGSVQYLSDNPQPSRVAGVSVWDSKIYSFGGTSGPNEYSNKLYQFDPQIDTWTELAEMPLATETKGEIVNGKLYVIGGYNGAVSNRVDVYNIASGIWEANIVMPVGISAHSTSVIGSRIYMVGDFANLTSLAYFDTFDNSIHFLSNNLNSRRHCAAEAVNGSLFAIGGNTNSSIESSIISVQKADIVTSIYETSVADLFELYPNPTSDILNMNKNFDHLKIYDIQGKEVESFTNVVKVNISKLKRGTYILKGNIGVKLYQAKFIKI